MDCRLWFDVLNSGLIPLTTASQGSIYSVHTKESLSVMRQLKLPAITMYVLTLLFRNSTVKKNMVDCIKANFMPQ